MSCSTMVWLIRHGETHWNEQRRFQGWTDTGLSATGRHQAEIAKRYIARSVFDGVWASDLNRAVETARILAGEPVLDTRLRELDFGSLEGATWQDLDPTVRDALLEFDGFSAPHGETVDQLRLRVQSFMDELASGDHLVVTHAGVIRTILASCGVEAHPSHCQITEINWTEKKVLNVGKHIAIA